jgi:hypothetical protein
VRGRLKGRPADLTEEQLKEIEARHATMFGNDFEAADAATHELAENEVPTLIAEIRRLRDLIFSRQA